MNGVSESAIHAAKAALAKCAANDPWFPQPAEATILAWAEQFVIPNLPLDVLLEAVTQVYAGCSSGFKPLPGDIIKAGRAIRAERGQRESDAEREARQARMDSRMVQTVAELAGDLSIPDEPKFKRPGPDSPLHVPCPHGPCSAGVGQRCTSGGRPLRMVPRFHSSRIEAARAASLRVFA